jgi:PAS domain S-box-containing protein
MIGMLKVEELIGKDFVEDVLSEDGRQGGAETIAKALEGEPQRGLQMPLLRKDGKPSVVMKGEVMPRASGVLGEDRGTTVRGFVADDRDAALLDVLDKLGIAAWFTDMSGVVDDCNKSACKLVEREKAEVLGLSLANELVSEVDRKVAKEGVSKAVLGDDMSEVFMSVVAKGGSEVEVSAEFGPRRGKRDQLTGSMVFTDPAGRTLSYSTNDCRKVSV